MRFDGHLKSWNDDRGFGFIEAELGGEEIFVHIKSFPAGSGRPQVGQLLSFEVELGPQGKKRAKGIELVRASVHRKRRRETLPAEWSIASALAIPMFLVVYLWVSLTWQVPWWIALCYLGASFVCFITYAIDKSAAENDRSRISENTLLTMGLACGWPGAILAQQALRHKTSKASFRAAFWVTVVVNVAAFTAIYSPIIARLVV